MWSKLSNNPKKFFDSRLAPNLTSSSCVDLNLKKGVSPFKSLQQISITLGTPKFPSPAFPSCHFRRWRYCHLHRMRICTGDGKREVCAESSRATKCRTSSPFVPVCPSAERAVTPVRRIPMSQCFLTASGNSTCPGTCRSQKASRGVLTCLDPMSTKRSRV
jgi:hypothetical protein